MDAGARRGLKCHIDGGFGLGKSKGSSKSCRVPFKHKLAHLLVDELSNEISIRGRLLSTSLPGYAPL
jgi:hypothetical protein